MRRGDAERAELRPVAIAHRDPGAPVVGRCATEEGSARTETVSSPSRSIARSRPRRSRVLGRCDAEPPSAQSRDLLDLVTSDRLDRASRSWRACRRTMRDREGERTETVSSPSRSTTRSRPPVLTRNATQRRRARRAEICWTWSRATDSIAHRGERRTNDDRWEGRTADDRWRGGARTIAGTGESRTIAGRGERTADEPSVPIARAEPDRRGQSRRVARESATEVDRREGSAAPGRKSKTVESSRYARRGASHLIRPGYIVDAALLPTTAPT